MTRTLTALVVDDERLARRELVRLLAAHPEIQVVGEAEDAAEARVRLAELDPHVVFLDISMPGESGFDLAAAVPASCRIVFVTAHSEFALRAFDANALDYLLKPVHPARLAETVQRLVRAEAPGKPSAAKLSLTDPLIFPSGGCYQVIRVGQIAVLLAAGDGSELVTSDGRRALVSRSLKGWEDSLPEKHFLRVHRSTIVNVDQVERIEPWFRSSFRLHVKRVAEPIVVSRRCATTLRERLV